MKKYTDFAARDKVIDDLNQELAQTTVVKAPEGKIITEKYRAGLVRKRLVTMREFLKNEIFDRILGEEFEDDSPEELTLAEMNRAQLEQYVDQVTDEDLDALAKAVGLIALERRELGYVDELLKKNQRKDLSPEQRLAGRRDDTRADLNQAIDDIFEEAHRTPRGKSRSPEVEALMRKALDEPKEEGADEED